MTDEKKAEEYVENKYHCNQTECIKGNSCDYCYREESKRDYLNGFAEGKKEKCFEQNKDGTIRPCEVMKENITLVKENVKLLDKLNLQNQRLNELKKENESRKKYIEKLKKLIKNNTDFYGNDNELYQIWKGIKMEIE